MNNDDGGRLDLGVEAGKEGGNREMEVRGRTPIRSYEDLEVYKSTYAASIEVLTKVIKKLPSDEKYDLVDQLRRSAKAIPRLIAEGYAKRHQLRGFHKYIDDAMAETNETVVGLHHCKDVYFNYVDPSLCERLIKIYNIAGKQLYRLREVWVNFRRR